MSDLPGIVVTGASGRMGQMLARSLAASERARLVGCLERPGHPGWAATSANAWVGRPRG
ncbi:hypothetical protein MASR1M32_02090 [Rhodobacter sp.]